MKQLQENADLSQRELADRIGISQNACWRRLQALTAAGVLRGATARLDRQQLGLGLVVFVMLRTRHHSADWLAQFRRHVLTIPEVVDFHRIGGDYDYQLKVVTEDMASYDRVYQRLMKRWNWIQSHPISRWNRLPKDGRCPCNTAQQQKGRANRTALL